MTADITIEDVRALEVQTPATLARWACVLNAWGWPEGLPEPEEAPEDLTEYRPEGSRRTALRRWIEERVGRKAISQEWNCRFVAEGRMAVDEHERWWASNGRR